MSTKKTAVILFNLGGPDSLKAVVPFLFKQDWAAVLKATFVPVIRFDKEFLSMLVAILGTTISPYLFFWQALQRLQVSCQWAHK